jgi:hypothetical protein
MIVFGSETMENKTMENKKCFKIKSSHLSFQMLHEGNKKTWTVIVKSNFDGWVLGYIKWHGAWRQYCFFPNGDCIWSSDCLDNLSDYIKALMKARRRDKSSK